MAWKFNDGAPIYLQIVNTLKRNIASGAYPPGSRLPSVRDLALEAGVNPNTMQRALSELELRKSMSEEIVSEFIARLRGIGMSDEQILDTVRDKINSEHKEET